jgi:hypothetical protein
MAFANKYDEEAHLLAQGLHGTKWERALEPAKGGNTRSKLTAFVREQPLTALTYAAGAAFTIGALWSALRR